MKLTGNRSGVDPEKIVIFGAGKIGRSFIGQLFGRSGYKVVFVDVDPVIISLLNARRSYRIVIKGEKEEEIIIKNVMALSALDREPVIGEISKASILAVSVGKKALEKVIPLIASGIEKRFKDNQDMPLDIILAENMRSAAEYAREQLRKYLQPGFPIHSYVGLIETSIGKMVPIMPVAEVEKDPLVVFAEPYNTLILDRRGFKAAIPAVEGLAPKNNISAWVDRKAFIHNLGHATAAFYGYFNFPNSIYMYEVLEDPGILKFTRDVMIQSAGILLKVYPDDFTIPDLEDHIDDLLYRFRNKALRDTICRVGQDLPRKLGKDDRFMGAIHLAMANGMPYNMIVRAMSYGFFFRASDEEGNPYPADKLFLKQVEEDFESALINVLGINESTDSQIIKELKELYRSNRHEKLKKKTS
jgi:mannitol-1-phosphate 5-dehydrogenase